jgi:hypothetical protein
MIERFVVQKRAIRRFALDSHDIDDMTGNEWELLEKMIEILEPIENLTKILSPVFENRIRFSLQFCLESSPISVQIPLAQKLRETIQQAAAYGVDMIRDEILKHLDAKFPQSLQLDKYGSYSYHCMSYCLLKGTCVGDVFRPALQGSSIRG